eukprot:Tbor_TRINITY_DN1233_c0_g1::TRINITY_DN1233_c0_g1_i1::g.5771::m.5771/K10393/KIF2_24, MCAK; kinesin family member 2/24
MSSRICVAVRKRPCGPDDKDVVVAQSPQCIVNEPKVKYDLTPFTERHTFIYDEVLDQATNNREVYQRCCQPLIDTLFSYANATCFAYGQTGSGKTHTMLGNEHEPGIYACAAKDVFYRCKSIRAEVYASFYEIYGRKLFDLLNDRNKLVAREDGNKEIVICGLTEHAVSNIEDLFQIISRGSTYRAAGSTSANSESSRSHAVLQMEVRENGGKTIGRISFIDLAGNERGADTFDCDRKTRMEGAEINKSLLALKECIRALGMGKSHIPFRGSVLTGVLRDSFLGNSRTTMIATISPTANHCENTLNTLRYTQRVKDLGGAAGGGREQIMEDKAPRRNVQAGRRKPANHVGQERPGWVDEFVDDRPLENELPPPPPRIRPVAVAKKRDIPKPKIADPRIATIVQNHMGKMEEEELSPTDDDDEDSGNDEGQQQRGAANKEVKQVRAVHAHVVQAIAKAEDEIMAVHRHHIDLKMSGIKEEIKAIQALDDKDSVDEYVNKVREILTKQRNEIGNIMDKLGNLQAMLKDEEDLSRTLTPAARGRGQGRPNYGR